MVGEPEAMSQQEEVKPSDKYRGRLLSAIDAYDRASDAMEEAKTEISLVVVEAMAELDSVTESIAKAAQGEVEPVEATCRRMALGNGWNEADGEGCIEFLMRRAYEQGKDDFTPPSPSAQVLAEAMPDELFDGFAVYQELDRKAKSRTGAENVSDVLDAVVRLIRRRQHGRE